VSFIVPTIFAGIIYILVFVAALMNTINPRFMWKVFESWKATSEPSEAYFRLRRIGGLISLILITLIMLGPTIMYMLDK
jgi:hypothetical protein